MRGDQKLYINRNIFLKTNKRRSNCRWKQLMYLTRSRSSGWSLLSLTSHWYWLRLGLWEVTDVGTGVAPAQFYLPVWQSADWRWWWWWPGRPQFPFPVSQCGADHGTEQRCADSDTARPVTSHNMNIWRYLQDFCYLFIV